MGLVNNILELVGSNPPWWVWVLAAFVPFCMLLSFREFMCWFWKINKVVGRLDRIERRLNGLQLGNSNAVPPQPKKKAAAKTPVKSKGISSDPKLPKKSPPTEDYTL